MLSPGQWERASWLPSRAAMLHALNRSCLLANLIRPLDTRLTVTSLERRGEVRCKLELLQ
jgi:hypothetical protein